MASESESEVLDTVKAALDEWSLNYQVVPKKEEQETVRIIEFGMTGQYTNYRAIISMDMDDGIIGIYYVCPLKIIPERRKELAQYFAAVNYKVMLGHFDLDFRDGEVRFKISTIYKGTLLSLDMVKQMVGISMKTMDRYFPGIMAVEFGNISPFDALAHVEQQEQSNASTPPPEQSQ